MKSLKTTNRTILSLFMSLALFSSCSKNDDDVEKTERTEVNIPDLNFEQALIDLGIDTNGLNGNILITDTEAVIELDVSEKNISSLEGIDAFTNLEDLECYGNNLTSLDIGDNLNLTSLSCEQNQLTSLNVSNNIDIEYLGVDENNLTSIDISNNVNLIAIACDNNQLTDLDVTNNINLTRLYASNNFLTSVDVSSNHNLILLKVANNQLTTLDLSQHNSLVELEANNNQLTSLNVKNGNNTNVYTFKARMNLNLYCIEVDDALWSNTNWSTGIDGLSAFSEDCN